MRRSSIFTLLLILIVSVMLGSMTLRAHAQSEHHAASQSDQQPTTPPETEFSNRSEPTPSAPSPAQSSPVLLASTIAGDGSRAWGVYRNSQDEHLLVLVAPREASNALKIKAAPPGQVQAMRPLGRRFPQAIAAQGDRVYLAFPPVYANERRLMRVYSTGAFPSPLGGLWVIDPPDRLRTEHPLETPGELVAMQATRDTLWALIQDSGDAQLLRLDREDWVPISLPDQLSTKRLDLSAIDDRIVLVDRSGTGFKASIYDNTSQQWSPFSADLPMGKHTQLLAGLRAITVIDWDERDQARLRTWSPAGLFTLASDLALPSDSTYSVLDSSNSLLGLRAVLTKSDSIEASETIELTEFDLLDNSVRYQGAPVASAPVSADEFRFLAVMMILVMLGVLVVVIMPDRTQTMLLPDHTVIADPGRRLIASMLDAALVATIVAQLFGVAPIEVLTLSIIVRPDNTWGVIPAIMIIGVVYATLFEWMLSATPGKLIVGIRVARAQIGPRTRPKFWSALVRNIIKWVLPPVAALALIDPETLHRGDRASRTLVVMPRPLDPVPRDEEQP